MSEHDLVLRQQAGWEEWMCNWILPTSMEDSLYITLYCCYHPDHTMFYASTDPAQAVAAFTREEFAYHG